jgi:tungstate transport system ATP-binding protein
MALAVEPEVILLDEPTSSLDPDNVALVEEIIRDMKTKKWLIVMVTHNVFQARRLADRVLLLLQGRIMEDNDAAAFFEQPASQAGRRFLAGEILYEGNGRVNPFPG